MHENIINRNLKFKRDIVENSQIKLSLSHSGLELTIGYNTIQLGELIIQDLCYQANVETDFLKIVDFYFELLNGKPIEVFDRLSLKELDAFINDGKRGSVIGPYGVEHFEILKLGSSIYNKVVESSKSEDVLFDPVICGKFTDLSFSEQVEYFEEFLAKFIYPDVQFKNIEIEIIDITPDEVIVESVATEKILRQIENMFNKEFYTRFKFKKIFF
jgi:hypothetical protein